MGKPRPCQIAYYAKGHTPIKSRAKMGMVYFLCHCTVKIKVTTGSEREQRRELFSLLTIVRGGVPEMGPSHVAQDDLRLPSSCLSLMSAGITGMEHYACLDTVFVCFLMEKKFCREKLNTFFCLVL